MKKRSNKRVRTSRKWHGAKWIRPEKRLAIYDRDSWCCVYCGWADDTAATSAEQTLAGYVYAYPNHLTLDHVKPVDSGGSNEPDNLVTACHLCNSTRQSLSARDWYALLRSKGFDVEALRARVRKLTRRALDMARGRALLKERYARRERRRCQWCR